MIDFSNFDNLFSLVDYFNTEDICKETIIASRWGEGINQDVVCPICGKRHYCTRCKDGRFYCPDCNRKFSCTVGTIFENTKISLRKWFMAMYLISSHKKGISSHQLGRDLKITQKTAWFILHKVRTLFGQDDSVALEGEVELDEMYLGGRETNKHESKKVAGTQGRSTKTKTPIFGMAERDNFINEKGEEETFNIVRALKVENTRAETLLPIIKQFVMEGSHLFTDELNSYNCLSKNGYEHSVVFHKQKQFAYSNTEDVLVTTNIIEGFWGHFKRMVFGIYHFVSKEYLQRYINEAVYRWNTRKASQEERFSDMFYASLGVVRYDDVRVYAA